MTKAHEADDWSGEFTVEYNGRANLVVRCPDCSTEKGVRVTTPYMPAPSDSKFEHCVECQQWKGHYPVREAERGEYDGEYICDECDTMYTNTMDADMCCDDSTDNTRDKFAVDA